MDINKRTLFCIMMIVVLSFAFLCNIGYATEGGTEYTYTLHYDANGGEGAPNDQTLTDTITTMTFNIDTKAPVRAQYRFLGWALTSTSAIANYSPGGTLQVTNANTTLFAVWETVQEVVVDDTTYTLTYNANGGTGAPAAQRVTNKDSTKVFILSTTEPTKTGFIFQGWARTRDAITYEYSAGETINVNGDLTLYAFWRSEDDIDRHTEAEYDLIFKTPRLGNYLVGIESYEIPSKEYLPIIGKEYFTHAKKEISTKVDNKAPSARYDVKEMVKVDVVFAMGQLEQIDTFKNMIPSFTTDLKGSNYIDANVEEVKTQGMDMANEFDWTKDLDPSIGDIQITTNAWGQGISMRGNECYAGKNGIWVIPEKTVLNQIFSFNYSLSFGDSFSAAGIFINIGYADDKNNVIHGYALVFGNYGGSFQNGVNFYELSYRVNNHYQFNDNYGDPHQYVRWMASIDCPGAGRMSIRMSESEVEIISGSNYDSEPTSTLVELPEHYGYGFGFFSEHYSHCCNSVGQFTLLNLSLERTEVRSLGDSLQDTTWRDGSIRVIIHATDEMPIEFQEGYEYKFTDTVIKLLSNNCYLINIGKDSFNKENLEILSQAIRQVDGTEKGVYYSGENVEEALANAVQFIQGIANRDTVSVQWILVNTEVKWNTNYHDVEEDLPLNFGEHDGTTNHAQPQDDYDVAVLVPTWNIALAHVYEDAGNSKIFAEKWRFRHFNNYFDNSPVQESFHNIWIEDPIDIFPNPGKYRINYKRRDNPFYDNVDLEDLFDEYRYWSSDYDYRVTAGT